MRITQGMLTSRTLRNLQTNYAGLAKVQEQITSGRKINRPSDDPALARSAVRIRDSINALEQHTRNIDAADRVTSAAETALASAGNMLARVKELALQAANGSISIDGRNAILAEVAELGNGLVSLANTRNGDDYVFSGQQTRTPAYASLLAAYSGDANPINARIAPGVTVQVNITGDAAFGPALAAVGQLVADLTAGNPPQGATIQALDDGFDAMLAQRTRLGAIVNRLSATREFVETSAFTATKLLSDLEDADMAEVISLAASRQATYQAALNVNAKILSRSLVDEL